MLKSGEMRGVNPLPQVTQDMLKMMLASVKLRAMPHTRLFAEDWGRRKGEDDAHGSLNTVLKARHSCPAVEFRICRDLLLPSASWLGCRVGRCWAPAILCWDWALDSALRSLLTLPQCWLSQVSALALPFNPYSRFRWASLVSLAALHTNSLGQDMYYYEFCKFCQKPPEDFFLKTNL